jgi:hypothetical protein
MKHAGAYAAAGTFANKHQLAVDLATAAQIAELSKNSPGI